MFRTTSRSFRVSASAAVLVCVAANVADSATVAGNVVDSTTSLPLAGVEVLVDGVPSGVTTDISGQFKAEVTEGERLFTFKRTGFSEQSIGPVTVAAEGETAVPPAKLAPDSANDIVMLDALDVSGELVKGSSGDLQNTRLKADVAIDFLSAEQISKFSAGDLAEAVIRIPGVSVANGQFAVVRGLSDRYLSTTLHGLKFPSPDPEKQALQMDLLPANAIGSIVVSKTFSSDLWAESAGGNIDVSTSALPEEQIIKVGAGIKFNTEALDGGPDYKVGDAFKERTGFGQGSRPDPGTLPNGFQYVPSTRNSFPLGNKFNLEYARTFNVLQDKKLGVAFGVMNETGTKARTGSKQSFGVAPGSSTVASGFENRDLPLSRGVLYDFVQSESESNLGANSTITFQFSPNHEIKLNALYIQSGIDLSQLNQNRIGVDENLDLVTIDGYAGFSGAESNAWFKSLEYYRQRNLTDLQLAGSHKFEAAHDLKFRWAIQDASTYQRESPQIEATYATPLSDPYTSYVLQGSNDSPDPFSAVWADNQETQQAGRFDFDLPVTLSSAGESTFKAGAAIDSSKRDVKGEAIFISNPSTTIVGSTPQEAIDLLLFGPNQAPKPGFSTVSGAERKINAAYLGANVAIVKSLKGVVGARFEEFSLTTSGTGKWGNFDSGKFYDDTVGSGGFGSILGTNKLGAPDYSSEVWYPGFGIIYEPLPKVSVRLHYSQTSGRPSLREVSPFFNKSIETGNLVIGNPALQPSDVESYDFRIEWNPSSGDSVAFSVFQKSISSPIEKIVLNTAAQTSEFTETWVNNANTADMTGVEFEFRNDLSRWTDLLAGFSVGGNATWIDASVGENPKVIEIIQTSFKDRGKIPSERRLYDQPEYIVNLDLTWKQPKWGTSVTLAGNAISDVLESSGLGSYSYDLYTRSFIRYDAIFSQRLTKNLTFKFSVKNITDPVRGLVYDRDAIGGLVERTRYRLGRDFSFSLTAEF